KIVSACLAGKDVFVVLSAEDTVDWRPYLGEAAQKKGIVDGRSYVEGAVQTNDPAEAVMAAVRDNRGVLATIPKDGVYTSDFSGFLKAVQHRGSGEFGPAMKLPAK